MPFGGFDLLTIFDPFPGGLEISEIVVISFLHFDMRATRACQSEKLKRDEAYERSEYASSSSEA